MKTPGLPFDPYEQFLLRNHAQRVLFHAGPMRTGRPRGEIAAWLCRHAGQLGIAAPLPDTDRLNEKPSEEDDRMWSAFIAALAEGIGQEPVPPVSDLQRRIDWISEALGLEEIESDLLGLSVRVVMSRELETLVRAIDGSGYGGEVKYAGLALLTGHSVGEVNAALLPSGFLRRMGLVRGYRGEARASDTVLRVACLASTDPERLRQMVIGAPRPSSLGWDDFGYLGADADLARRLLAGALDTGSMGLNLLLHGRPGTGKTEFAAVLAESIGARAIFVGEADNQAGEPSRNDRIAAFALTRALSVKGERSILVVDEAEDIFVGVDDEDGKSRVGSKVFMNRFVECAQTPTLWITNHPDRLGAAVLRRMAMAVHFPLPGKTARRRIVERAAARHQFALETDWMEGLVSIDVAPATMDNALRVAKLAEGRPGDIEVAAHSVQRLLSPEPRRPKSETQAFDPGLSAADHDLSGLADRIASSGELAFSLCLYGQSGTGKSAYARYLASRLGLDVLEVRASDLLSKWVGATEQRIAEVCQRAADQRVMLILDEADSLLRNRAGARASWEVTQVNEMLTWMENHPLPFACTTNLMETLDPAVLRRFLFKVRFMPMRADQAEAAFERIFGMRAPAALSGVSPLTPADFSVALRKARLLAEKSADALFDLLRQEVAIKPGAAKVRIGF